jgi:hypothetical protein
MIYQMLSQQLSERVVKCGDARCAFLSEQGNAYDAALDGRPCPKDFFVNRIPSGADLKIEKSYTMTNPLVELRAPSSLFCRRAATPEP